MLRHRWCLQGLPASRCRFSAYVRIPRFIPRCPGELGRRLAHNKFRVSFIQPSPMGMRISNRVKSHFGLIAVIGGYVPAYPCRGAQFVWCAAWVMDRVRAGRDPARGILRFCRRSVRPVEPSVHGCAGWSLSVLFRFWASRLLRLGYASGLVGPSLLLLASAAFLVVYVWLRHGS